MNGGRTAMTQSHSVHGGALSFMSCTSGRETSPLDDNDSHQTGDFKIETKKKRFHPLRNLRRMFRRKTRHLNSSNHSYNTGSPESTEISTTPLEQRSCSTSKLAEENGMQNLMKSSRLAPGLSLSHDSVFTPDRADSGLSSSDLENSSLSISNFVPPPTEYHLKSHSSCSESSLLSMGSSEAELSPTVGKSDLDLGITSYKLSHSAAKHKMAVKPKRNHGAPRSRRRTLNSKSPLPSTPEVNEDVGVKGFVSNTADIFGASLDEPTPSKSVSPLVDVSKTFETEFLAQKIAKNKISGEKVEESLKKDVAEKEEVSRVKNHDESLDISEEDWRDREEEVGPRKEESFFGRLLSRRSEKKKKNSQEKIAANEEQSSEEQPKNAPVSKELKSSASCRSVNRRQRVEPIEIPSSPSLTKKNETDRSFRDNSNRMKVSYSMSPPKSVVPNPFVSRSSSPPKVVWPEHFSYYKTGNNKQQNFDGTGPGRNELRTLVGEDSFNNLRRDMSPTLSKTKETQKIIADEVESKFKLLQSFVEERKKFESVKEDSSKMNSFEKDEADKFIGKKQRPQEEDFFKFQMSKVNEVEANAVKSEKLKSTKINMKSSAIDSVDNVDISVVDSPPSLKPASDAFSSADFVITHEEPHYVNLKNIFPVLSSYEKIHHGYENVQVIELVKKEKEPKSITDENCNDKKAKDDDESEKRIPRYERPKSIRKDTVDRTPEFMKVQLNRVEPRIEAKTEEKLETEKPESPKVRSTLIERRKSELMLANELDEKDWKAKVKVLKKQTSFSEVPKREGNQEKFDIQTSEKTEIQEEVNEVIMRKKPNSSGKSSDDQPELMKVFARRSLKVRESEEIVEEMRRSRDSDKENENLESPKEERKKMIKTELEDKKVDKIAENESPKAKTSEEVVIHVTPLKPDVGARKSVFQKYGRNITEGVKGVKQENGVSSPENRVKKLKEQSVLEENKSNKMKESKTGSDIVNVSCVKEVNAISEEDSEETGFKRIQQRKAEWERRVQQAAK